jgi:O-antigen/teichoic acid export membrane protein
LTDARHVDRLPWESDEAMVIGADDRPNEAFAQPGPIGVGAYLIRSASSVFGLRVALFGLSFLASVILARALGSAAYGVYTYALAWVMLLSVFALVGSDQLLVRELSAFSKQERWGLARGLLRRANQGVLAASVALSLAAGAIAWGLLPRSSSADSLTFTVALCLLPLIALTRVRQAAMGGLQHVVLGALPETLVQPFLLIALAGGYLAWQGPMTAPWAMGLNALATGLAFALGAFLLHAVVPSNVRTAAPAYRTAEWAKSAVPLLFLAGLNIVYSQTAILMLGAISGTRVVGLYGVANRGAELIAFVLTAVNAAMAPTVASQYATGDVLRLQQIVTRVARVTFFLTLPAAVGMIGFGHWFLRVFFGAEYVQAQNALFILSWGQVINVAMGSVGLLLIMTGHEWDAAFGIGASTVVNLVLSALLIPRWGLEGAALSAATSMVLWNVLMAVALYRRVGIHSTLFGKIGFRWG